MFKVRHQNDAIGAIVLRKVRKIHRKATLNDSFFGKFSDVGRSKKRNFFFLFQVEQYREMLKENGTKDNKGRKANDTATSALAGLLNEDYNSSSDTLFIDNAWRGAEVSKYPLAGRYLFVQSKQWKHQYNV